MNYEYQYLYELYNIYQGGIKEYNKRTQINTLRLANITFDLDLNEVPVLYTKKVYWKSVLKELEWIFQKQSNDVNELGCNIWNKWADENGSIGKSYGYQVNKKTSKYNNQVEYVLETLRDDKSSRRAIINLWNTNELDEMNLVPCVYTSIWNIIDNKLNCVVVQRSADFPVGLPFDVLEYNILARLFAIDLGVDLGRMFYIIADGHIYENQMEGVKEQLTRAGIIGPMNTEAFKWTLPAKPTIEIPNKSFFNQNIKDIKIKNYNPLGPIKYVVNK